MTPDTGGAQCVYAADPCNKVSMIPIIVRVAKRAQRVGRTLASLRLAQHHHDMSDLDELPLTIEQWDDQGRPVLLIAKAGDLAIARSIFRHFAELRPDWWITLRQNGRVIANTRETLPSALV